MKLWQHEDTGRITATEKQPSRRYFEIPVTYEEVNKMGIQKKEFYIAKCDICKDELQNGEGGTLCLDTKDEVKKHLDLAGWTKKNGKIACENCCEEI